MTLAERGLVLGVLALGTALGAAACGGAAGESPGGAGLDAAPWRLAGDPHGRSVPLVYTTEECVRTPGEDTAAEAAARFEKADVEASRRAVTITVLQRPPEGEEGVACGSAPIAVRHMVTLPETLGDRALRDGSTSPPTVVRPVE